MAEPAKTTERVNVQLPDGRMGTVAPKDVASVLDQRGRIVSDAEFAKSQKDLNLSAKYSGVGGFAESQAANIAGGLRGLSAGLSDPILVKGAGLVGKEDEARSKLSEYQEAFPVESMRGEVAGIVIPAAATGGGRAPVGVSGLLARGGVAVERAALGSLERAGAGFGERMLVKGAAIGAQGAAEGAAYGVGHAISEASLGNHELTADKLLAGAKGGALYGFVGGAAIGGAGELVSGAVRAIPKTFAATAGKEGGTLSQWLERKAGEMTLRHAGADKTLVKSLDKYAPGGHEGVGKLLAEEAPALVGKQRVGQMNQELWAEAAAKGKQVHGAAMDGVLASAGKGGGGVRVHEIVDEIRRVADPFRSGAEHIGKEGVVRQMDGFADQVAKHFGLYDATGRFANPDAIMSLKDLHNVRRSADDLWAGSKINPLAGPIKDIRDAVSMRLAGEIEKAGGAEALQAWKDANQRWQAFNALERAAANKSAQGGANQFLSLTDKVFAAVGGGVGSLLGGGPVGGLIGGAVTGLASKALRSQFDAVAAETLLKASRLGAAKELAGSVDAQLGQAVRGFLTQGAPKEAALAAGTALGAKASMPQAARVGAVSREDYERTAQQVAFMSARRKDGRTDGHGLENFAAAAPNVSAALAATHSRAIQYLSSLMPPARVDHTSVFVPGSMYVPKALSPAELKWLRCVEAVKDPMGVLRDFRKGHISGEQVDALKAVYPSLYAHLRQTVMEHAQKSGRKLSVEQVSALGVLLGEAVHYTQRPEFLVAMQASKSTAAPLQESGGAPQGGRKPDIESGASRAGTVGEDIER